MSDIEQRTRERAYRIWLDEGCPQGRELDHWDKATELVAIEEPPIDPEAHRAKSRPPW